jgi:hypothetical protein
MHVIEGEGHEAVPVPGSARTLDGAIADLRDQASYPVIARCAICGAEIGCQRLILADFYHLDEE